MKSVKVLVVEDEPGNQEVARVILESAGHAVVVCENGQVAVDLLRGGPADFDLILMDILMPVMDGLEATQILKADPKTHGIPIICVSARASGVDREVGADAGCDHYMTKPFRRSDLLAVIAGVLERHHVLTKDESAEMRSARPLIVRAPGANEFRSPME